MFNANKRWLLGFVFGIIVTVGLALLLSTIPAAGETTIPSPSASASPSSTSTTTPLPTATKEEARLAATPSSSDASVSTSAAGSYAAASINNLVFSNEDGTAIVNNTIVDTRTYRLTGDWSVPNNTGSGGFTINLPPELQGRASSFSLLDSSNTSTGSCTVTSTQLVCVLDEVYLASHPLNVGGSFYVFVTVGVGNDSTEARSWYISGQTVLATVDPAPGKCADECAFSGQDSRKTG